MEGNINYTRRIFYTLAFFAIIASLSVLKVSSSFFVPLGISVLLSFVFYPFVKKLHKFRMPWTVAILVVVLVAVTFFVIVGNLLVVSLMSIINAYPKYEDKFMKIYSTLAEMFKLPFDAELSLFTNLWNSFGVRTAIQNIAISFSNFMISSAKFVTLISVFVIFLLLEMRGMKLKVVKAFAKENLNKKILFIATKTVAEVTHYISIKFIISMITGALVWLVTFAIGMDFSIVWGFLAFILNFIPNFGSTVSWALTTLFAFIQFYPEVGKFIFILVSVLVINMTLGNVIEPRWMGSDLGLSPFVILVSLSLWGTVWGFVGMILSVPLTVIIKIICENIKSLKPVAIMIGNNSSIEKNTKEEENFTPEESEKQD